MKIIISDYLKGLPHDLKWKLIDEGFKYINSEQIDKNTVAMMFTEAKGSN